MEDSDPSMERRTVLRGLTTTITASAIATTAAATENGTQYTGISYCPVTDKQQSTATAVLNKTPNGLTGQLKIGGFDIKLGTNTPLQDSTDHPDATRYTFHSTTAANTITHNGEDLGLTGRIDSDGQTYTGIITRPHPKYGNLAFSLAPTAQGFSPDDIAATLNPNAFHPIVPGFDKITIPSTGIPTDNSLRHLAHLEKTTTTTSTTNSETISTQGTAGGSSSSDPDVGVLDSKSNDASLTESLESYCDDKYGGDGTMSWTLAPNITAERRYDATGDIESDYDEIIQTSAKIWRLQVYLDQIPDPIVELCDQKDYHPYQANVKFNVRHGFDTSTRQFRLQNPRPDDETDDSTDDSDGTIGTLLDIVAALGGPYASIANTVIDYALIDNPSSDIFTYDDSYYDPSYPSVSKEEFSWDIPLESYNENSDGSDVFADTTGNTVGVEFEISNKAGDGKTPEIESNGFYTWTYQTYVDGYCPCQDYNTTLKTNSGYFGTLYADYTSINDPDS